jgi:hypothetical protein
MLLVRGPLGSPHASVTALTLRARAAPHFAAPLRLRSPPPKSSMSRAQHTPSVSALSGGTAGAGGAAPTNFRLATYNVLSSHLASPEHFKRCKPEDLAAATRLPRVLAKLQAEIDAEAIICLQEVSMTWAGARWCTRRAAVRRAAPRRALRP